MPYIVKKGSGSKPYKIVNQRTRKVVGSSGSLAKAYSSINHRLEGESKPNKKK